MQADAPSPGRTRRRFTKEFKADAVAKAEGFPTTVACRGAQVTRRGFFACCRRSAAGPSAAELAEAELVGEIRAIHADSGMAVAAQVRRSRATAV